MGQATPTGQVSPPPRPYSLSADARAWWAALRGLRDNPLLTHLLMAERRRRKLRPAWCGAVTLVGITIAAVLLFAYMERGMWRFAGTWIMAAIVTVNCAYGVWFLQCVFQAVLGALGVLGRWVRRPSHLVLDDFTCLSNLTDHEISAAAVAWLWPPLARCCAWGGAVVLLLATNSEFNNASSIAYSTSYPDTNLGTLYHFAAAMFISLQHVPLIAASCLLSAAAALELVLWFICLGRGLNVERIGLFAAGATALTQIVYPIHYEWAASPNHGGPGFSSQVLLCHAVLILLAPVYTGLLLSLARRLPWLRATLTVAGPVSLNALLMLSPLLTLGLVGIFFSLPTDYLSATRIATALAGSACTVLAPQWLLIHAFQYAWIELASPGTYATFSLALLVPLQLATLYILSRFTIEAVGARRRRGE